MTWGIATNQEVTDLLLIIGIEWIAAMFANIVLRTGFCEQRTSFTTNVFTLLYVWRAQRSDH